MVRDELAGGERAAARRALRSVLAERGYLRDIPFERIEAALDARGPGRRVFLKRGARNRDGAAMTHTGAAMRQKSTRSSLSEAEIAAAVRRMAERIALRLRG